MSHLSSRRTSVHASRCAACPSHCKRHCGNGVQPMPPSRSLRVSIRSFPFPWSCSHPTPPPSPPPTARAASALRGGSISQNCIQNVRALQCLRFVSEIYHTLQQLQQTRRNFREIYQSRTDDSQVPPSMQHTLDCPILPCKHLTYRTRMDTAGALHR